MAIDGTDFAGNVEPRNRFLHRVKHSLLDVVLRAALGIVHDGPSLHHIEGWLSDRHHGFRGALLVLIFAALAERIPSVYGFSQDFRVHINLPRDIFERIAFLDPTFFDLGEIVLAPARVITL